MLSNLKSLKYFFFVLAPLLQNIAWTNVTQIPSDFVVNLKDPVYQKGVISTDQGGVIEAQGMRIQAKKIEYIDKEDEQQRVQKIIAQGDLMVDIEGRIFVGEYFEYDFLSKKGVILEGKTSFNLWFMGGERIELHPDKSFTINGAWITTSETKNRQWDIWVKKVHVTKDMALSAENVQFRANKFPIFWFPYYKSYLRKAEDPPMKYKVTWDKGQGPKFTMRYRLLSWEEFNLYFRLDFRVFKGPGAAIETDYFSPDKRTKFLTKNYYSYDTYYNADDPKKEKSRYRLQGIYDTHSLNNKTTALIRWDRISERNMPGDFKSDDFELNTEKRTEVLIRHFEESFITGLNFRPRINSFQGFKQELPNIALHVKPFEIANTGVVFDNRFNASYLNYVFSDNVKGIIPDFASGRFSTTNALYRPVTIGGLVIAPLIGFDGIYYTNSQKRRDELQAVLRYDLDASLPLYRKYRSLTHNFKPYLAFRGLTKPTAHVDDPFIFGIRDGYNRLNQLKIGMRNAFYLDKSYLYLPNFAVDFYVLGFFGDSTYSKTFPKAYGAFEWNRANISFQSLIGWNFQESVLDRSNLSLSWTVNEDYALSVEYRHRSKFDWRKDNLDNYILDVTRDIPELVDSPLSDGRNSLGAKFQLKLAPDWILQAESHFGWGRKNEPGYSEAKIDLITMITSAWRLKISYMHTVRDDQFKVNLFMAKH